jgi:4,5-DOPA dioxygenase extradiol
LNAPEPGWVSDFAAWVDTGLQQGDVPRLLDYRALAPFAVKNHPTEEHLLPLFVALGAGGPEGGARHLHASATYGVLRMDAYAFGRPH